MNNRAEKIMKNMSTPRQWFTVNAEADIPEMLIYDMIGTNFWGEGCSPKAFRQELNQLAKKSDKLNLRINSPGGFIHDGFTIYNSLIESGMEIDVYIDGLAASAAAFIAMAGTNIYMPQVAEMMIHNAWGGGYGQADDLRKQADHLDSLTNQIAGIFARKTGQPEKKIREMMDAETWMDADAAVEMGFATERKDDMKAAACVFDLDEDLLPGISREFVNYQSALKKRALEKNLRDAGLSRAEAARRASGLEDGKLRQSAAQNAINQELEKWAKKMK